MKILITESRLYNAFKGWMDSEIREGILHWRYEKNGDIYLMESNSYRLWIKSNKPKTFFYSYINKSFYNELYSYFPLERTDLLELIGRYVGETLEIEIAGSYTQIY